MRKFKTEQEEFWAGDFGKEYINRNKSEQLLASNLYFFSKALEKADKLSSCIEFGANVGMNLKAIKLLYPDIEMNAIEINPEAAKQLAEHVKKDNIFQGSIIDFSPQKRHDLVIIKGVLIHINPEMLMDVYKRLHEASGKYILIAEYYNPTPVAVSYRGHSNRLFKRDFAGEMMDKFVDLKLIDYGFSYRRDNSFPQDDVNWFLLEKR